MIDFDPTILQVKKQLKDFEPQQVVPKPRENDSSGGIKLDPWTGDIFYRCENTVWCCFEVTS